MDGAGTVYGLAKQDEQGTSAARKEGLSTLEPGVLQLRAERWTSADQGKWERIVGWK